MKKLLVKSVLIAFIPTQLLTLRVTAQEAGTVVPAKSESDAAKEALEAAKQKMKAAQAEEAEAQKKVDNMNLAKETELATAKEKAGLTIDAGHADQFTGFGFGAGIGAVFDVGGKKRIKTASVDTGGIIRVEAEQPVRVGALLETHFLFGLSKDPNLDAEGKKVAVKKPARVFFHGPQVCVALGDDVIDGIGVGYMLAFRRRNEDPQSLTFKSFNLGVGAMIQPSVQTLGSGLEIDRPLPAGDQLRYRNAPKAGVYAVFSVTF